MTNAYEEDESDETVDGDGHSSPPRKRVTWKLL